jgi:hypothetical protein
MLDILPLVPATLYCRKQLFGWIALADETVDTGL